jgi:hypothetical protein
MWGRRRGRGKATQKNGRRDRGRQAVNLGGGSKGDGVELQEEGREDACACQRTLTTPG